jgi:hypothetical protein
MQTVRRRAGEKERSDRLLLENVLFGSPQKMTPGDEDEVTLLRGGRLAYGCYELTYTGRSGGTALEMDAATLNLRIALLQVTAVRSRLGLPSATQHPLAKCCTTQMLIVAV